MSAPPRGGHRRWLLLAPFIAVVVVAGGIGFAVAGSSPRHPESAVEDQVRTYFDIQLRITIVPPGTKPGSVPVALSTDLRQRVITELPTVMTGSELTTETKGFFDYVAALSQSESATVVVGGGVDRISFDGPAVLDGSLATVSGSYDYHSDSYHWEDGRQASDSFHATSSFTVQLTQVQGVWLVSSISTTLLSQT